MIKNKGKPFFKVVFSLVDMILYVLFLLIFMLGSYYAIGSSMSVGHFFLVFLLTFIPYSTHIQFEYKIIELFDETILIKYPINYIIKKREFQISDIDFVEYKPVVDSWIHPYFRIMLKDGREKKFTMSYKELLAFIDRLESQGVKTDKIDY